MSTSPFPDNSDKSKNQETAYHKVKATPSQAGASEAPNIDDDRPKVGRIVSEGAAIKRSTPLSTKIKNFFIGPSAASIVEYVIHEVLIPSAKDAAHDAVLGGLEKRLYGDVRSVTRRSSRGSGGLSSNNSGPKVHYDRMSSNNARPAAPSIRRNGNYDIGQIIIPTRAQANEILEMMFNIIGQYEVVTVAELMEMAGMTPVYTDRQHGWTSLRGAQAHLVRGGGYLLDLPAPEALER